MKLLFFIIITTAVYSTSFSQSTINLTITKLRNTKGHLLVSLFNSKAGFPDKEAKAFRKERLSISGNTVSFSFTNLPAGQYAIAILHDEDDNLKMNSNFFGMPKEGYGFSRNVTGFMGPPSFADASFSCIDGKISSLEIRTRY